MKNRFLLFFLTLFSFQGFSAHIIGGFASYKVDSIDLVNETTTLSLTFRIFRNAFSGGAPFDRNAGFGIYAFNENQEFELYGVITNLGPDIINSIDPETGSNHVSIESGDYNFNLTFRHGQNYVIAYQRCCRDGNLSNIVDPGESGIAIELIINNEALMQHIDSPALDRIPFTFAKINADFSYDLPLITDALSDVSFSFISPKQSGGVIDANTGNVGCCECVRPNPSICFAPFEDVFFTPSFSPDQPFGGENKMSIDPLNGRMEGEFNIVSIYLYGIEITQSFNGKILSKQILDHTVFSYNTTSLEDELKETDVSLYPNPTTGMLNVELTQNVLSQHPLLEIFNSNGKLVFRKRIIKARDILNLELESGLYFIYLRNEDDENKSVIQRIMFFKP